MAMMNMVQALNLALDQEMGRDADVILLGEDIGPDGGVFRVTDNLWKKYGEERVIDTPLAESSILGVSIGMAMAGLKPVCEMQFSGFSYLAIGHLEGHATRYRSRTHGAYTCPLVMRMPYGAKVRALEHHSESREATFSTFPGCKVVIPSGPRNARSMLVAAIRDPDPVVFMEPKHEYRSFREEVPEAVEVGEIGKAHIVEEGTDITVIAWGAMMRPVLKGVETVKESRGASIELIDLLTIHPMDITTIVNSVKKTGRCVIVQEAPRSFSTASEIIARLNDDALLYLEAPVKRITSYDVVTPYFGRENAFFPNEDWVVAGINETLDF